MNKNLTARSLMILALMVFNIHSPCFSQQKSKKASLTKISFDTIKEYQINVNKGYFHDFPIAESIKKSYLIVGDYINPLKTVNGFYYIEYQNSIGNTSKGWISRNDILVITTVSKADLTPQSQANNGNKSNSIREKSTDINHEYLALTELMYIFYLENHDATAINETLKEFNSQWAYYGTDSGDVYFDSQIDYSKKQVLIWHQSNQQLEYIILNPQEFISIVNQIKTSGFTLAKTQLHQSEEDKAYVKKNIAILTAKIKFTEPGKYGFKIVIVDRN